MILGSTVLVISARTSGNDLELVPLNSAIGLFDMLSLTVGLPGVYESS